MRKIIRILGLLIPLLALNTQLAMADSCDATLSKVIGTSRGFSCIIGNDFDLSKDPLFTENTDIDRYYYDLKENSAQNNRIRAIYKNDKTKNGPFDYCTEDFGCRFIKRGGDATLQRIERDNATQTIGNIRGTYTKRTQDAAAAASIAGSIKSKNDVPGDIAKTVYQEQIDRIRKEVTKDVEATKQETAKLKASNEVLKNTTIPNQKKVRDAKDAENKATVVTAKADLDKESVALAGQLQDIGDRMGGSAEFENDLKNRLAKAVSQGNQAATGMYSRDATYSNNGTEAVDQLKAGSQVYRMNGLNEQADRMEQWAVQLNNFEKGNSLLYQSLTISEAGSQLYGEDVANNLKPTSFGRFAYIVLLNTFATNAKDHPEYGEEIKGYFRLASRQILQSSNTIGEDLQNLETDYAILDWAGKFTGGAVKFVGGIGALITTPIDDHADALAYAMLNSGETWAILRKGMGDFYDKVMNCPNAQGADHCASIIGEHAVDLVAFLSAGRYILTEGPGVAKAALQASKEQFSILRKLEVKAAQVGLQDPESFAEFLDDVGRHNPCTGSSCYNPFEPKAAEIVLDSAKTFTDRLTPGKIRSYLSEVNTIPRENLISDMESIGLSLKGTDRTRPFLEFVDHKDRLRAKIHPPDKATDYHHLHIYDKNGKPMTSALETIAGKKGYKSPDAHIEIMEP